jgi:anti-sigma B factor antagonist
MSTIAMFTCLEPRANVLTLFGELTLSHSKEIHARLFSALGRNPALEVDLLNVTQIDTAGLQLLMLLHREALASDKQLRWLGFSLVVQEAFELLDLSELLGRPGAVLWS